MKDVNKTNEMAPLLYCRLSILNLGYASCCVKTPKIGSNAPDFVCFSVKMS